MDGLPKILLVEDNPQILEIYSTVLRAKKYPLQIASSVADAMQLAKDTEPDIIFLDIMLPGNKTGLDALMMLRTDAQYKCTDKRIVMLTNLGLSDDHRKSVEEYADGYVIKAEINPHDLYDIIDSFKN
jgi:CheY-like chemotaxis protein